MACSCVSAIAAAVAPFNQRPRVANSAGGSNMPTLQIALAPLDPSKPALTTHLLARFCPNCGERYRSADRAEVAQA